MHGRNGQGSVSSPRSVETRTVTAQDDREASLRALVLSRDDAPRCQVRSAWCRPSAGAALLLRSESLQEPPDAGRSGAWLPPSPRNRSAAAASFRAASVRAVLRVRCGGGTCCGSPIAAVPRSPGEALTAV